ncbi:hypothetical protein D3C87_1557050 [compost metagenome]
MTAGFTIVVARILQITLYAIEFVDQVQRDVSTSRLAFRLYFLGFNKPAPCVRPAAQTFDSGLRTQRVITGVIIGHHIATITIEQACRHLLRAAGGVVKKDHWFIWRAAGLHPHPGLAAWVSVRLFQHLYPCFIAVDNTAAQ